ncbi:Uncharacterised protein [Enterobacter hormaechei]|nr:Uncharacterised protein [Enterobacter hormaechei]SAD19847.1 Uncharacterised protein [Enterobacter hormaechei]SAD99147.1 Uncharacterised protein [Enterobacter hormaechei]SAF58217.1 Uncharacterised protein [Enterobacter hormaechei]SAG41438.1 Uncharacterised protein [Enterobacter hormaechei]
MRGAGAVADAVRRGGRHGVKRFTQLPHLARRNGCSPLAIGSYRGAVRFAVEHHGHHRACRQAGSRTGDRQILGFLGVVDHIVTGHGVNGQHRRGEVDFNLVRCAVAVSGFIGQRRGDGVIPCGQSTHVRRRHAHVPLAGSVQGRRVIFVIDGDGHHVTRRRTGHGTGDNQRLRMLGAVDHVVVGNGVNGQLWHRGIHQHIAVRQGRVTRLIRDGCRDGVTAVGNRADIRRRYGDAPAAVRLYGGGVVHAVQRHGDGLARFGVGDTVNDQILLRFGRVDDVVVADDLDGHRRRGGVHAVLAARRGAVAVHVGDADLHAGVAVFQSAQIGRRYGRRPVAAGIHRRAIGLTAENDSNGLVFFHVGGRAGQHQIRTLLGCVNHVVGSDGADADGDRRQIHLHVMADGNRITRRALAVNGHGDCTCAQRADVSRRNGCTPCPVRQHGCRVGFAVDGDRQRRSARQPVAGAGDNQVLSMLDAVDHIVACHGIHAQARQAGINRDVALAGAGVAVAVGHARCYGEIAVTDSG